MGVFYVFKIVQMVPNRAKQDIYSRKKARLCYKTEQKRKTEEKMKEAIREEMCHWCRSGIFIVNFEHISHLVLVFLLLTLNMQLRAGRPAACIPAYLIL